MRTIKQPTPRLLLLLALALALLPLEAGAEEPCEPIEECAAKLRRDLEETGMLGIGFSCDKASTPEGLALFRVAVVMANSPAERAGLLEGDMVFEVDERTFRVGQEDEFHAEENRGAKPGQPRSYRLLRRGIEKEILIEAAAPDEEFLSFKLEFMLRERFPNAEVDRFLSAGTPEGD